MTEPFDAVLAEGREGINFRLKVRGENIADRKLMELLDRLAAAHAAEVAERDRVLLGLRAQRLTELAEKNTVIERERARAEAAERDARRYRWLRDMPTYSAEKAVSPIHGSGVAIYQRNALDAAIDAAIATTEQAAGGLVRDGGE